MDVTTDSSARIEPFDSVTFLLELAPLFTRRAALGVHEQPWSHVRVRVPVAGRRDIVARTKTIKANPKIPQLSGESVGLGQFLRRILLRAALLDSLDQSSVEGDSPMSTGVAMMVADFVESRHAQDGTLSYRSIHESLELIPQLTEDRMVTTTFSIAFQLRNEGFVTNDELSRHLLAPRTRATKAPPDEAQEKQYATSASTKRERLALTLIHLARAIGGERVAAELHLSSPRMRALLHR